MSITTVRAALATLEAQITGINRAYVDLPRGAINDADLPLFLNFARDASDSEGGSDMMLEDRQYLLWLLVMPDQLGIPGEGEQAAEAMIQTVKDYFRQRPALGLVLGVQKSYFSGDSGPRKFTWADVAYWGVEFRLRVVEYQARTYADDE